MATFEDTENAADAAALENGIGSDVPYQIQALTDRDWREINKGLDRRFSGLFVSGVNGKLVPWRGEHHLAALSLFELDPAIDSFEVMPERISLSIDGKLRSYIPAFRLRCGSITLMVDVLHPGQEKHPKRAQVSATIRAAYGCIGVRYRTMSEREVFAQPRQRNARYVLEYRGFQASAETELAVVKALGRSGKHTIDSLTASLAEFPDARDTLFFLATRRRIKVGLWATTPGGMPAELLSWKGLS
jgi:hypothetical protein